MEAVDLAIELAVSDTRLACITTLVAAVAAAAVCIGKSGNNVAVH